MLSAGARKTDIRRWGFVINATGNSTGKQKSRRAKSSGIIIVRRKVNGRKRRVSKMITEEQARRGKVCRGCGKEKASGLVVCWVCFKLGNNPLKYFEGSFGEWLEAKVAT